MRAPAPDAIRTVPLGDGITALFHRPSGTTHLLAEPAPEILALLAEAPLDRPALARRLGELYDVAADAPALDARLAELIAAGLIEG